MIPEPVVTPYTPARLPDGEVMTGLGQVLARRARMTPDLPAIRTEERTWTFAELDAEATRLALWLVGRGLGPGDRVAVLGTHHPRTLAAVHGAARAGMIPVVVNPLSAPRELTEMVADCDPAAIVLAGGEAPGLSAEPPADRVLLGLGGGPSPENLVAPDPGTAPYAPAGPDEVGLMLYTSGTTGRPKGIELTGHNLVAQYGAIQDLNELGPGSVAMAPLPFFHIAGLGYAVLATLNGAELLLLPSVPATELASVWLEYGVTHVVVVPAILQALVGRADVRGRDWSRLRYMTYGASAMTPELLREAQEVFGCRFLQGYGLTETTGGVTLLSPDDHDRADQEPHRLASVGRSLPGSAVAVIDPDTLEVLPPGAHGEVVVGGHQVMRGYWRDPEETASARVGGWFRTGDVGSFDEDGFLYLHDRLKDMLISGGENVYPAEIERVLSSLPGILDAAVVGVPSRRWGESPFAVVVRALGSEIDEETVLTHCREQLARFKVPTGVAFVVELPRNATGKVRRGELRRWVLTRTEGAGG